MRRFRTLLGVAVACAALSAPVAAAQDKQPTASGTGGAAASVDPLATNAAIDVLKRGGNAYDAAIAAASVLGVVEPYSCGLGGGGFMTIRDGRSGRITTIDSREMSPKDMKPDSFFINGQRRRTPSSRSTATSGLSVGVPRPRCGTTSCALRHDRPRQGALLRRERRPQRLRRRPDVLRPDGAQCAVLRRRPRRRRSISTPTAPARRRHDQEPDLANTYDLLGRDGVQDTFYNGAWATRSSAPPTTRRSAADPRGGPAC